MLAEDDAKHHQVVYYQAGIGTGLGLYDQLLGGGTGMSNCWTLFPFPALRCSLTIFLPYV